MALQEVRVIKPFEELGEFHHGLLLRDPPVIESLKHLEVPVIKDLQ